LTIALASTADRAIRLCERPRETSNPLLRVSKDGGDVLDDWCQQSGPSGQREGEFMRQRWQDAAGPVARLHEISTAPAPFSNEPQDVGVDVGSDRLEHECGRIARSLVGVEEFSPKSRPTVSSASRASNSSSA